MTAMTLVELRAVRDALRRRLADLDSIETTCAHCVHFASAPRCSKFGADVPTEFSRTPESCLEWQYDGIPF